MTPRAVAVEGFGFGPLAVATAGWIVVVLGVPVDPRRAELEVEPPARVAAVELGREERGLEVAPAERVAAVEQERQREVEVAGGRVVDTGDREREVVSVEYPRREGGAV